MPQLGSGGAEASRGHLICWGRSSERRERIGHQRNFGKRSPPIVTDREAMQRPGVLTASEISCLVIPGGCLGLHTLAALEQGIPVIVVREDANAMRNDLTALPWAAGQLHVVENYWEAAGVITAIRAGIAPESVRRPRPSRRW